MTSLPFDEKIILISIIVLLIAVIAYLLFAVAKLDKKVKAIPHLKLSDQLRVDINQNKDLISQLQIYTKNNNELLTTLQTAHNKLDQRSYRSVISRYNPFKDSNVGGNQSFTAVFADADGNGLMITSLYSREMNRVSAKELIAWDNADYNISPEERATINSLKSKS